MEYKFIWKWCDLCEGVYIECPKCGNNCCNVTHGTDVMGEECDVCSLAYQYQDLAYRHRTMPSKEEI